MSYVPAKGFMKRTNTGFIRSREGGFGYGTGKGLRERTKTGVCTILKKLLESTKAGFVHSREFSRNLKIVRKPKGPAILKILNVVNLIRLRVVNLLSHGDLLSRRTLCGHHLLPKTAWRSKDGGRSKNNRA